MLQLQTASVKAVRYDQRWTALPDSALSSEFYCCLHGS